MNRFPGNNIHETAIIYDGVKMGTGNTIGAFCIIGSPAEWKNHTDGSGNVVIGNNNTITGMVTIDSGVNNPTEIWDDCFIMKHAYIGHDSVIENNVTISSGSKIGGHAIIGANSNIGMNAVIHQKCLVPNGCMIGASGFVGKKQILKPHHKYAGVPVREIGINI